MDRGGRGGRWGRLELKIKILMGLMKAGGWIFLAGLLSVVVVLTGCSTVEQNEPRMPEGTYRESGTGNFIVISNRQAVVHIEGMDLRDDGTGVPYNYHVSGPTFRLGMTNSLEPYTYPGLSYYWREGKIIATDPGELATDPNSKGY